MNNKLQPALIGGVVLGILSAIPLVGSFNICCCAWALVGGALAAYLYVKRSPVPVGPGDGALVGIIAGLVGAVIYIVIGVPLSLIFTDAMMGIMTTIMERANPEQAEAFRQQMELAANQSIAERLPMTIAYALGFSVLLAIFSTIGGLLGTLIFEKRKGGTPSNVPPPPPDFNRPAGGGYGNVNS